MSFPSSWLANPQFRPENAPRTRKEHQKARPRLNGPGKGRGKFIQGREWGLSYEPTAPSSFYESLRRALRQ